MPTPSEIMKIIQKTDFRRQASRLTPVKSIRWKCLDCQGGQGAEIRRCGIYTCPLWPYRMGRRPRADELESDLSEARDLESSGAAVSAAAERPCERGDVHLGPVGVQGDAPGVSPGNVIIE